MEERRAAAAAAEGSVRLCCCSWRLRDTSCGCVSQVRHPFELSTGLLASDACPDWSKTLLNDTARYVNPLYKAAEPVATHPPPTSIFICTRLFRAATDCRSAAAVSTWPAPSPSLSSSSCPPDPRSSPSPSSSKSSSYSDSNLSSAYSSSSPSPCPSRPPPPSATLMSATASARPRPPAAPEARGGASGGLLVPVGEVTPAPTTPDSDPPTCPRAPAYAERVASPSPSRTPSPP